MSLVRPLPWDRVDVIGDVHGEIDALTALLAHLGCDASRARVDRPLVFVGDLVDRGPDSVAVVELVKHLVDSGVAEVVMGNHELNLVRDEHKEGNGWYFQHDDCWWHQHDRLRFDSRTATAIEKQGVRDFFDSLPLALESSSLRIVHAAWDADAVDKARQAATLDEMRERSRSPSPPPTPDEPTEGALHDKQRPVAFHPGLAARQLHEQNTRPHKILTSGRERVVAPGARLRFLGGQWRMLERDPWWERDDDPRPVVFGHYWRRRPGCVEIAGKVNLFSAIDPLAWFGKRRHAFCVDYSCGRRYEARHRGEPLHRDHGLAALRWPERTVCFDDGTRADTTA